ncbi:MAG: hypothetical protein ABSF96_06935, partial [Steroidobacteraceae bacterium]
MSSRTVFLSRLLGLYCIVIALSMFLRGQSMVDTVTSMLGNAPLMFFLGAVITMAGLAMVLTHNIWSGGSLTVLVTLLGWIGLIKGALFLLVPPGSSSAFFLNGFHYQQLFYLYAAITLIVGLYLSYGGFRS